MSSGLSVCTAGRLGAVSPARILPIDLPQRQTLVPRRPTAPLGPADRRWRRRIRPRGLRTPLENPAGPLIRFLQLRRRGGGGVEASLRGQRSAGRRCGECDPSSPPGLLRCFREVSKEVLLRKQQTAEEGSSCVGPPPPSDTSDPPDPGCRQTRTLRFACRKKKNTYLSCLSKRFQWSLNLDHLVFWRVQVLTPPLPPPNPPL